MGTPPRVTVAPRQSLGQNFLVDDNIAAKIVRELRLAPDDEVVEIGPGHGALTNHLATATSNLTAVEIDGRVIAELRKKFHSPDVEIIHADIMNLSFSRLRSGSSRRLRVVGNIPYHLTSPIIFKSFDEHEALLDLTIMIQREVARRIVAGPSSKEYGILSVLTKFYGSPTILFNVSPHCFYPKPNVSSSVIRIAFHESLPEGVDKSLLKAIVKATFGKRRKTLRNGLKYLELEEDVMEEALSADDPLFDRRPEQLGLEEFVGLTMRLQRIRSHHAA